MRGHVALILGGEPSMSFVASAFRPSAHSLRGRSVFVETEKLDPGLRRDDEQKIKAGKVESWIPV
jgi:hypothetical protein